MCAKFLDDDPTEETLEVHQLDSWNGSLQLWSSIRDLTFHLKICKDESWNYGNIWKYKIVTKINAPIELLSVL